MILRVREAKRSAQLVIKSLTDLGYSWQTQVGDLVTVRFQSVAVADLRGATWAICEVATLRRHMSARGVICQGARKTPQEAAGQPAVSM